MTDSLTGIRVLDLGQYLAGPLAAMMLADQGAEVVRIEPPGGPRWTTPLNKILLRDRAGVATLDLTTGAGRQEARQLAGESDVVVENFRPGVLARLGLAPDELLAQDPRLVVCSLPGFGSRDPRAGLPGWEGVVLAAAGCYATGSREMLQGEWWPSDGPAFTPLMLGSVFGATLGAVGITAALLARERDGLGQLVEVPLYDAFFEAIGARVLTYQRNTPPGALLGSGFYRCSDGGYVSLITVWYRHLEWFLRAAGHEEWLVDGTANYDALKNDDRTRAEFGRRLVGLLATRTAAEWEELGLGAGVPLAAVRSAAQWQEQAARLVPESVRVDAAGVRPAPLVRVQDRGAVAPLGRAAARGDAGPLSGTRVVDMTRVLAAPTVARILAELGAEVTKVDVAPGTTRAGLREPFFHESVNRGKQLLVVDVHAPGGAEKVAELCAASDVLVTNFTQPALRRLGVDVDTIGRTAPHLVHAYVNAFGTTGPWADLRGYAEIANTVTGITARTLGEGPPSGVAPNVDLPRSPATDYAAGILGAFAVLLGLLRRERSGRASAVETTLVDAACLEQLAQLQGSDQPADVTGMLGWSELQRLYRTSDGWVFLGIAEVHWDRLADLLGAADPEGVEMALAVRTAEDAAALVAEAGGAVHPLVPMDDLLEAGGIADRLGLRLEQQSPVFGAVVQPGPVIRLSRTPMRAGALPDPVGLPVRPTPVPSRPVPSRPVPPGGHLVSHMSAILDPTGRRGVNQNSTLAPRSRPLRGATIGLLDNGKVNGANLLVALGRLLGETEGVEHVHLFHKPYAGQPLDESQLKALAESCDFVVTAIGDCGSCSAATLADGILLEREGVPAASICTEAFSVTAAAMAQVQGFPGYRFVRTRHPVATLTQDELDGRAREIVSQVLAIWGAAS